MTTPFPRSHMQAVVAHHVDIHRVRLWYLVQWKNREPTWELYEDFKSSASLARISAYWRSLLEQQADYTSEEDNQDYEVEAILYDQIVDKKRKYLVRWKDWKPVEKWDCWLGEDALESSKEAIADYTKRREYAKSLPRNAHSTRIPAWLAERAVRSRQSALIDEHTQGQVGLIKHEEDHYHECDSLSRNSASCRPAAAEPLAPVSGQRSSESAPDSGSPTPAPRVQPKSVPSPLAPKDHLPAKATVKTEFRQLGNVKPEDNDDLESLLKAREPLRLLTGPSDKSKVKKNFPITPLRYSAPPKKAGYEADSSFSRTKSRLKREVRGLLADFNPLRQAMPVRRTIIKDAHSNVRRRSGRKEELRTDSPAESCSRSKSETYSNLSLERKTLSSSTTPPPDVLAGVSNERLIDALCMLTERDLNDGIAREEPDAPTINVLREVGADNLQCMLGNVLLDPAGKFVYASKLLPTGEVEKPKQPNGCGCIGVCLDGACACWKRQTAIINAVSPQTGPGFAYDTDGCLRFRVGDGLPVIECNASCGCGPECQNRIAGQGRQLEVDLVLTCDRGWGINLAQDSAPVPAGTFFTIYTGEIMPLELAKMREEATLGSKASSYMFDLDFQASQTTAVQEILRTSRPNSQSAADVSAEKPDELQLYSVDAANYGNLSRFLNHSCLPNMYLRPVYIDDINVSKPLLAFYTYREIQPGEELTISYKGDGPLVEWDTRLGRKRRQRQRSDQPHKHKGTSMQLVEQQCRCGAVNCDGSIFLDTDTDDDEDDDDDADSVDDDSSEEDGKRILPKRLRTR